MRRSLIGAVALVGLLLLAACGGANLATANVELVSAGAAAEVIQDAPDGLVVLDIRTADEFAQGHLAGATNIDFYAADFRDQLDRLDKTLPYVLYCRSGNRTGQTAPLMRELGFEEVYEIDGGIVAWFDAGQPVEQ